MNSDFDQNYVRRKSERKWRRDQEKQLSEEEEEKYNQSNIQYKYNEIEFEKRKVLEFWFENVLIKNNQQ